MVLCLLLSLLSYCSCIDCVSLLCFCCVDGVLLFVVDSGVLFGVALCVLWYACLCLLWLVGFCVPLCLKFCRFCVGIWFDCVVTLFVLVCVFLVCVC